MLDEWFFELQRLKNEGLTRGAEKGYTMNCPMCDWFSHLAHEYREVIDEYQRDKIDKRKMLKELADLSNMCDLIFEEIYKK